MSVLLFVLGAFCAAGGAVAILFGIPVKEFSFGNTLIIAGATALVGGLIVVALAAAVAQLQRIVDILGARPLSRSGRPLEPFDRAGAPLRQGKIPFPPKPKADRPAAVAAHADQEPVRDSELRFDQPPSLHNPDVPLVAADDAEELPLSPRHAGAKPGPSVAEESSKPEPEQPSFQPEWRTPPPRPASPNYFESMWPSSERSPPPPPPADAVPSRAETIPRAPAEPEPQQPAEEHDDETAPVAVLKSGVVDGMSYTLYVDGSIEAKLPEGTLRFASINELRTHLEQNP